MKIVNSLKITPNISVKELVSEMNGVGFGAGRISEASKIMNEMFQEKNCKVFFGVAGAMVPAGLKYLLLDILDEVDVFVTTGATLTHDLIEALGEKHYLLNMNKEGDDFVLRKKGFDRMYNVAMPNVVYEKMEKFFESNWKEFEKCKNIRELLWKIGEMVNEKESLLKKCYEKKIPVFCPALADSGIGLMIWGRIANNKKINIDAFDDMKEIIDVAWTAKRTGVIYVGGGTPKNFIQQSLQFSKGADYGIQITTDRVEYGGSSGAPLKEGISWGKLKNNAKYIDVYCDATIALPLIYASIK